LGVSRQMDGSGFLLQSFSEKKSQKGFPRQSLTQKTMNFDYTKEIFDWLFSGF
jgi:hypothetical protein